MLSDRRIVNLALIGFMGTGKTSVGRLSPSCWIFIISTRTK
jgi:hypothetical protein